MRSVAIETAAHPRPPEPLPRVPPLLEPEAEVYRALTLGTADYFRKNRFRHGVLGLSGGIDSALALTVAADALGPDAVTAVSMPSRFTAAVNREDARELAERLGVELVEVPIADLASAYDRALAGPFAGAAPNVAEENLQAPHPRQPADGPLQQVRMAGAHDRKQERDERRLTPPCTGTWRAASRCSRTC